MCGCSAEVSLNTVELVAAISNVTSLFGFVSCQVGGRCVYGVAELAMQLQANDIDKFYVSFAADKYRRLNYDRLKLVGVQAE